MVPSVVLAPAERYVVEVRFEHPGQYALVNSVQAINHLQGRVRTGGRYAWAWSSWIQRPRRRTTALQFATLRANAAVSRDIDRFRPYFNKPPDKRFTLTVATNCAAARNRPVHGRRHGVLRARRVDRRHAGHELAVDEQAGPVDHPR